MLLILRKLFLSRVDRLLTVECDDDNKCNKNDNKCNNINNN